MRNGRTSPSARATSLSSARSTTFYASISVRSRVWWRRQHRWCTRSGAETFMSNLLPPSSNNHHPLVPSSGEPLSPRMAPADAEVDDAADEIDLKEVLGVLRRHVKLIAGITILVGAAAGYIAHISRPSFQAGAVIRLVDQKQALTSGLNSSHPSI